VTEVSDDEDNNLLVTGTLGQINGFLYKLAGR